MSIGGPPPTTKESQKPHDPPTRRTSWWLWALLPPALWVAAALTVIITLGIAQRVGWISASGGRPAETTAGQKQTYTCPMHPQIRQPGPGRCPICGMELAPATNAGQADLDELSVKIAVAQRRLANIQTQEVRREPLSATIQAIGAIAIDESRMATIASYVDGRLERLFADYTGVEVAQGDHLAVVYSPESYSAQVEYLESRKALARGTTPLAAVRQALEELVANTRQKLVELGMRSDQIKSLEKSQQAQIRLTIFAPVGGTVTEKMAVEGNYIKAGEPIYRIADLSMVWLMLELYPEDAARIRYGQQVEAKVSSLPSETFHGRIAFIDPTVNPQKRTVGVRVEFLNDDRRIRPGDYADATIFLPIGQEGEVYDVGLAGKWISPMHPQIISDTPGECPVCGMPLVPTSRYGYSEVPIQQPASLYVPRSALLMAGNNSVVYVEEEPGRFEIRSVIIGPILRDRVIILDGLKAGEMVATAGNFLIDSQMQLAGKPSLIDPTRAVVAQRERKDPLDFPELDVARIEGEAGQLLEELFDTYFKIQQTLAEDSRPDETDATQLHNVAVQLQTNDLFTTEARAQLAEIAKKSQHLHHLTLDRARHDAFRPISHAVVTLATLARSDTATEPFRHMFCPMVKGGAGDWLHATPNW